MIIHVVQPDDTIDTIAEVYGISVTILIQENGLTNPDNLVIGQTIVIVYPEIIYTVQEGDTLTSIADKNGITLMQLLRNNPYLSDREFIYPGETLVISYETEKIRTIAVSGYTYPFIDMNILRKTLPFLTYLTVFNYRITFEGDIVDIDDTMIIQMAKDYGVAPVMMISTLSESGIGSREVTYNILNHVEIQNQLIDNVINKLSEKGYYGLNIYLQYIFSETLTLIEEFIIRFTNRLHSEGYGIIITVAPRPNIEGTEYTYERIDYSTLAQTVDRILFLSYEWGYSFGPPASVTPVNVVRDILNYIVDLIPPEKILLGLPIIGYDWPLPYIPGATIANAITTDAAIQLASDEGVSIRYNEIAQAPYFFYTTGEQELHIVWFKDARSIDVIAGLVPEYGLHGLSIWNIMYFFTQMWLIINTEYDIEKVLDIY